MADKRHAKRALVGGKSGKKRRGRTETRWLGGRRLRIELLMEEAKYRNK